MECFVPGTLSETGAPRLISGEVQLCVVGKVSLHSADKSSRSPSYPSGTLYVTTHRLFWASNRRDSCAFTELSSLCAAAAPVSDASRVGAPRLLLSLGSGVRVCFPSDRAGRAARDRTCEAIVDALRRRAWVPKPPPSAAGSTVGVPSRPPEPQRTRAQLVGVDGAINARRDAARKNELTVGEGFASLAALELRAADLVELAARFRSLKADPERNEQHNKLLNMMADMCIDSPVTKQATGKDTRLFRLELARELSAHLVAPVVEVGGIMTLTDAYFLINRARATNEYVSPDDFMGALALFRDRSVGSRLTVFVLESGVRALKVDMAREPGGIERVAQMAEDDGRTSISALELMQRRTIPVQTALELLETAERAGLLARDETTAGVRFFRNKFPAFIEAGLNSGSPA